MDCQVAIYGMGRFGRALAGALPAGVLARTGGRSPAPPGWDDGYVRGVAGFLEGLTAQVVFLAVPDDALVAVAQEFAALPAAKNHDYVHASGVRGAEAIGALGDSEIGVFHILQSFPAEDGAARIPGSYVTIAGDVRLAGRLKELAATLGLTPVMQPDPFDHVAYHAAAVLASNALIGLLDAGRELLVQAGLDPEAAGRMLIPLSRGTLANAERVGVKEALTGPVVRGDTGTIQRHLDVLTGDARRTYVAMMLAVCDTAERAGRTPPEKLAEIRELLRK
jgi:predicted short-subunit dehydrogenase-like oxidoreductase (DUF2520 family)